jgi:N-ethylmaleimide reductase
MLLGQKEISMNQGSPLFSPVKLGALDLAHRVVMAPLTRLRSLQPGNIPSDLMATYYGQRASAGGLVISEATDISADAHGYPGAPGIHSPEQMAGWRQVALAIHTKGGVFVQQIWHTGRISHPSLQPNGDVPMAPSAVKPTGMHFDASFNSVPFVVPRAMAAAEIEALVEHFASAATSARDAGADGVEVHSANGYLLDQFLQDRTNRRTDRYGGSVENRARLLLEVVDAVSARVGYDRVGVRLSPFGTFNDMVDSNPEALFRHVLVALSERGIGYLHLVEPRASEASSTGAVNALAPEAGALFRKYFGGPVISAGGFDGASASDAIRQNKADAVAFGRLFIANPDLPERLRTGAPLNAYDRATFYGGDARGYTDYPELSVAASA